MLNLQYLALERRYRCKFYPGQCADAVNPYAQTYHIELVLRESLDACRIQDVPHRLVAKRVGKCPGILLKQFNLSQGEIVVFRLIRSCKMRKDGLYPHPVGLGEIILEFCKLRSHKAQTVHAGVQLDMYGVIAYISFFQCLAQNVQSTCIRDAGFQIVVNDFIEEVSPGSKHEYGLVYAGFPQLHSLHRISHCKIVSSGLSHHFRKFHGTVPVGIGLDQHQHFGLGLEQSPEIFVVVTTSGQVQFKS